MQPVNIRIGDPVHTIITVEGDEMTILRSEKIETPAPIEGKPKSGTIADFVDEVREKLLGLGVTEGLAAEGEIRRVLADAAERQSRQSPRQSHGVQSID